MPIAKSAVASNRLLHHQSFFSNFSCYLHCYFFYYFACYLSATSFAILMVLSAAVPTASSATWPVPEFASSLVFSTVTDLIATGVIVVDVRANDVLPTNVGSFDAVAIVWTSCTVGVVVRAAVVVDTRVGGFDLVDIQDHDSEPELWNHRKPPANYSRQCTCRNACT